MTDDHRAGTAPHHQPSPRRMHCMYQPSMCALFVMLPEARDARSPELQGRMSWAHQCSNKVHRRWRACLLLVPPCPASPPPSASLCAAQVETATLCCGMA